MSLGPVNNNFSTQQTAKATPTARTEGTQSATEGRDAKATQPTNTPTEAERATATPEAQDAARQRSQGVENQIKNQLDQQGIGGGEWQEARRRTRSTRGGRQMAQGPTRGLGGPDVA